jgi:hypothetical protein
VKDPQTDKDKRVLKTEPMRLFIDELKAALQFSAEKSVDRQKDTEIDPTLDTLDPGTAPTQAAQLSPKRKGEVPLKQPRGVPGSLSPVPAKPKAVVLDVESRESVDAYLAQLFQELMTNPESLTEADLKERITNLNSILGEYGHDPDIQNSYGMMNDKIMRLIIKKGG